MPQDIIRWSEAALESQPIDAILPEQELFPIIVRLCELRANGERFGYPNKNPATIDEAHAIDAEFVRWMDNLPLDYAYMKRSSRPLDQNHSDTYHVYRSVWIVSIWNTYRCARILLIHVILNWNYHYAVPCLEIGSSEYHNYHNILDELASDICDSIPFILYSDHDVPRAAVGASLIWPLYLVATMDIASVYQRSWVISCMEKIGHIMGIRQAASVANVLRYKKEITAWDKQAFGEFANKIEDEDNDDW